MNNRQNGRRRGRGGQQPGNGQPGAPGRGNRVDNRARGNAAQLLEKYKNLARDAQMAGDRVNTEYYLQFADHYFRVLSENRSRFEDNRPEQRRREDYRDEFGREDFSRDGGEPIDDLADDDEAGDDVPVAAEPAPRANGWNGREPEGAAPVAAEPRRERAPREAVEMPPRAAMADEGERYQERRPRRARTPRAGAAAEPAPAGEPQSAATAPERIEVDRLPQGFGTAPAEADPTPTEAPAPRRRAPRRPRSEATTAEA